MCNTTSRQHAINQVHPGGRACLLRNHPHRWSGNDQQNIDELFKIKREENKNGKDEEYKEEFHRAGNSR
jgi:hypothetical protein